MDFDNWEDLDHQSDPEELHQEELMMALAEMRYDCGFRLNKKEEVELYNQLVDLLHSDKVNAQDVLTEKLNRLKKRHPAVKAFKEYHKKWLELI